MDINAYRFISLTVKFRTNAVFYYLYKCTNLISYGSLIGQKIVFQFHFAAWFQLCSINGMFLWVKNEEWHMEFSLDVMLLSLLAYNIMGGYSSPHASATAGKVNLAGLVSALVREDLQP